MTSLALQGVQTFCYKIQYETFAFTLACILLLNFFVCECAAAKNFWQRHGATTRATDPHLGMGG